MPNCVFSTSKQRGMKVLKSENGRDYRFSLSWFSEPDCLLSRFRTCKLGAPSPKSSAQKDSMELKRTEIGLNKNRRDSTFFCAKISLLKIFGLILAQKASWSCWGSKGLICDLSFKEQTKNGVASLPSLANLLVDTQMQILPIGRTFVPSALPPRRVK